MTNNAELKKLLLFNKRHGFRNNLESCLVDEELKDWCHNNGIELTLRQEYYGAEEQTDNDKYQELVLQYADDIRNDIQKAYDEPDFNKDDECRQAEMLASAVLREQLKRMNIEPTVKNFDDIPDKKELARQLGFELKEGE